MPQGFTVRFLAFTDGESLSIIFIKYSLFISDVWEVMPVDVPAILAEIRSRVQLSQEGLAHVLGVSFVSVNRWERGAGIPSPAQLHKILEIYQASLDDQIARPFNQLERSTFSSRGIQRRQPSPTLFDPLPPHIDLSPGEFPPVISRVSTGQYFGSRGEDHLRLMLAEHSAPAATVDNPPQSNMSAGKNTYTYDAHTYHTKVPPQGIAELVKHYLPDGGLVLDAFAGSGMTGVACRILGYDSILNELSPAACFIANRFISTIDPGLFNAGVTAVLNELQDLRASLYTTNCRECGKATEILYTVWSYRVLCNECGHEFLLWDHCRKYGKRVRDHKILTQFPCPACGRNLEKSHLKRTIAQPVQIGYICCGSRQQEMVHPLSQADLELVSRLEALTPVAEGYYPRMDLPDGVNLRQPKNHGIDRIDRFYTPRNLAAMSHLWRAIHRIADPELAAYLAFVFTSLYQRVTRLSEFRFWGGSGNTARFNVPFIFNEANVFITFARKARTIQDHLEATAIRYRGRSAVIQHSATLLDYLPDESVDLIFTDPPFGANINYSEMNILWESWLGRFTDAHDEAIVNKVQGKDVGAYQSLMTQSLKECYRVLRSGHWLLLVFMNSSSHVWDALRAAIVEAGFEIHAADIFDKQHGTFKHFVSENTAGCDLVLYCLKPLHRSPKSADQSNEALRDSIFSFLSKIDVRKQTNVYLHVSREEEIDFRKLYSDWIAKAIFQGSRVLGFAEFRTIVKQWLDSSP
ncbi:MAG TPA: DNA methyltransferase [Ktedonobacterales bacterium]